MTHAYHPEASELNILNEHCEDCQHKTLGDLDSEHIMAITGVSEEELRAFLNAHPALFYHVMSIKALAVQRERIERIRGDQKRQWIDASWAPLQNVATHDYD